MQKKYVLITGASRGIGRACALAFAGAGYHVFLNSRRPAEALSLLREEILKQGGSCTCVPGDVSSAAQVSQIFEIIRTHCPALDVLVNNAGIAWFGLLTDMTDSQWQDLISTNLSSVFYCCRAAVPYMVSRKAGKIINVSSMWGTSGASCEAAYSASKSGVHGLTKALAKELAPSNIQINAIACGVIDTEMNARLNRDERAELAEEVPVGRFGTPEETAQMILMLAEAPEYLTGQIIGFDGAFL